ncbi:alkaline phosphatase family protein [uncultured Methanobrevibacter sp.]|uniref:alkaline phosphatase family protein n=1 Tax=uncultured Methanobrevibacter sp. TaxID=253161 RepID=UPI00262584D3
MINRIENNIKQVIKLAIYLILEVIIFFSITKTLGGIIIPNLRTAFIIIVSLSLINALIWHGITLISLRFLVLTLGFGTFLIDGILLYIISLFLPGVSIGGIAIFSIPLLIGVISSILSIILNINDDTTYYRYILEKEMKTFFRTPTDKEGFIFLEIDGLSHKILKQALENGDMPTLKRWIDNGSHNLVQWETDLSSQTSSSQAGILHGNNDNIPAFRWVEKIHNNRIISSNGINDSKLIEKRISNGKGLLSDNGGSRSNLFSGDAKDYILTFSRFSTPNSINTRTWYYIYSTPFVIARMLILFLFDMIMELISRIRQLVKNIQPKIGWRGLKYFASRAGANVVLREATTFTIIGDIFAGQYNVIYATYMGYDEIAHHSGIDDFDSFYSLRQIDKQIEHIENAVNKSNRKYNLIILSDHGQSNGPTFKQKYKISLNDLVKTHLPEHIRVHSILHSNDDHFAEKFSIKPIAHENKEKLDKRIEKSKMAIDNRIDNTKERIDNTIDNTKERLDNTIDNTKERIDNTIDNTKERISNSFDGELVNTWDRVLEIKNNLSSDYINRAKRTLFSSEEPMIERLNTLSSDFDTNIQISDEQITSNETAQTIVLASGNLGLIYFTDWSNRMSYEQIEDAFPGLINGLASHEGIGFLMVKSDIYGTVVLKDENVFYLNSEEHLGENFLEKYGEHIIEKLKRTDGFTYVPDILVNSEYDVENDEVYAFEELIGSHGGAGGSQQYPFILHPSNWNKKENIFGSENVYKFFKEEINKTWKIGKNK